MAKTESTAVNQLIANLQGRPLESDSDHDDLGFEERTIPVHEPGKARPAVARTSAMSAPARALSPQAAPPPMPRSRSANGTEIPPLNGAARTSSTRQTTIPPLPNANGNGNGNPRQTMHGTAPGPIRSSTLPPPLRHSAPNVRVPDIQGTPAPEVLRPSTPPPRPSNPDDAPAWVAAPVGATTPSAPAATVPSLPSLPPLPVPVRGPVYPVDATAPAQLVDGKEWFDSSSAVPAFTEAEIGTQGVRAAKKTNLGFLIGTAFVCALAGVFVGGYLVFNGAGGAKPDAAAKPASLEDQGKAAVAAQAAAPAPAVPAGTVPAPAAGATDDDKAEPAPAAGATDDDKAEPAAEPAKPEPAVAAAAGPAKPEPVTEPAAPAPAVAEPAKLPPAPAPAVAEPAPAPAPTAPVLVDVLFLSNPTGASVVLVDGGRTITIGTTPVSASIDVAHSYEAVFALDGHQTRIAQLDPRRDRRFTVDLKSGKTKIKHGTPDNVKAAPAEKKEAAARDEIRTESKSRQHKDRSSKKVAAVDWSEPAKPEPAKAEIKKQEPKVEAAVKPAPAKPAPAKPEPAKAEPAKAEKSGGGLGLLMIAAKPPCEIIIDGKSTGLTTPQRSIDVPAGTHKITLVNKEAGIKKTIAIKITAGKATKLIQDYTSEMKK